ncbi:Peroxidase [Chondrus crispus]|uniref:Peroxidase n=1 Tax=Chondrus crispus TaxID=2769 RepID=R7QP25_CHOCR|nr:Peroxidase [Chondrus crispus]CDF39508.1 Peroxidase [Chondrus crispus]|eukprot:XP_005719419.1 Peroxidase [Chondrus crispus]
MLSSALLLLSFLVVIAPSLAQAPVDDGRDAEFLEPAKPVPDKFIPPAVPALSAAPSRSPPPSPSAPAPGAPAPLPSPSPSAGPKRTFAVASPPLAAECLRRPLRFLSGQCTSTAAATWGEAQRPQFSYLSAHSSTFPTGASLKSAREISNILCNQKGNVFSAKGINELFVFFGQFVDHNLVATPATGDPMPILVPENDPWFKGKTMRFVRSTRGFTGEENYERPINTLSSALDLSAVYGVNDPRNTALLEMAAGNLTGKMKTSEGNLLPYNTGGFNNAPNSKSAKFYLTGDHRANEHPTLTTIHTIWVREHNRIVDLIREKVPAGRLNKVDSKQIYEWARALNIAKFQSIVYKEFVPTMIGRRAPRYNGFRKSVNPTVSDIFAGAAFRVGHTMVGNKVSRRSATRRLRALKLSDMFFRPSGVDEVGEMDNLIRGAAGVRAQEVDVKVHNALRNMLFENVPGEDGFDLVAMNIQRGRDHALPTFNQIRQTFGIRPARKFSDISRNSRVARLLSLAYEGDVDAVEAWPGMMAEDKIGAASCGQTMRAVWEAEFTRLAEGDQFFYRRTVKMPPVLKMFLTKEVNSLYRKGYSVWRDVVVQNTKVERDQLPSGNIFTV